ncbi:hypothetical protein CYMTET_16718 [Cymbomonas tetramitiformis]|uniref:Cyclic nucleotide-binding domain-containing protein n=1 Tax=Cymbomonas tetramitiformis TaxID=36881 RepID=A0AAE0L813_9CHLO|nr:hypothetical protein CYMTET_16718 [Cymbomonas tetramitiformis]
MSVEEMVNEILGLEAPEMSAEKSAAENERFSFWKLQGKYSSDKADWGANVRENHNKVAKELSDIQDNSRKLIEKMEQVSKDCVKMVSRAECQKKAARISWYEDERQTSGVLPSVEPDRADATWRSALFHDMQSVRAVQPDTAQASTSSRVSTLLPNMDTLREECESPTRKHSRQARASRTSRVSQSRRKRFPLDDQRAVAIAAAIFDRQLQAAVSMTANVTYARLLQALKRRGGTNHLEDDMLIAALLHRHNSYFKDLPVELLLHIAGDVFFERFTAGSIILAPSMLTSHFRVIAKGTVHKQTMEQWTRKRRGESTTIQEMFEGEPYNTAQTLACGDSFGEQGLESGVVEEEGYYAATDVMCFCLDRPSYMSTLGHSLIGLTAQRALFLQKYCKAFNSQSLRPDCEPSISGLRRFGARLFRMTFPVKARIDINHGDTMYIIKEGSVELYFPAADEQESSETVWGRREHKSWADSSRQIVQLEQGDVFGEGCVFEEFRLGWLCRTLTPVSLLAIKAKDVLEHSDPVVMRSLRNLMTFRMVFANAVANDDKCQSPGPRRVHRTRTISTVSPEKRRKSQCSQRSHRTRTPSEVISGNRRSTISLESIRLLRPNSLIAEGAIEPSTPQGESLPKGKKPALRAEASCPSRIESFTLAEHSDGVPPSPTSSDSRLQPPEDYESRLEAMIRQQHAPQNDLDEMQTALASIIAKQQSGQSPRTDLPVVPKCSPKSLSPAMLQPTSISLPSHLEFKAEPSTFHNAYLESDSKYISHANFIAGEKAQASLQNRIPASVRYRSSRLENLNAIFR